MSTAPIHGLATHTPPTVTAATHLAAVLNHARSVGLPLPKAFRFSAETQALVLNMSSVEEVRDWSRWMQVPLCSEDSGRELYWSAEGVALDARVLVSAFSANACHREQEPAGLSVGSEAVMDGESLVGGGSL